MHADAIRKKSSSALFRFCQQCGKLEALDCFEGKKRSCRLGLQRRRQSHLAAVSSAEHKKVKQCSMPGYWQAAGQIDWACEDQSSLASGMAGGYGSDSISSDHVTLGSATAALSDITAPVAAAMQATAAPCVAAASAATPAAAPSPAAALNGSAALAHQLNAAAAAECTLWEELLQELQPAQCTPPPAAPGLEAASPAAAPAASSAAAVAAAGGVPAALAHCSSAHLPAQVPNNMANVGAGGSCLNDADMCLLDEIEQAIEQELMGIPMLLQQQQQQQYRTDAVPARPAGKYPAANTQLIGAAPLAAQPAGHDAQAGAAMSRQAAVLMAKLHELTAEYSALQETLAEVDNMQLLQQPLQHQRIAGVVPCCSAYSFGGVWQS